MFAAALARLGSLKGLWSYLAVRSHHRTVLDRERERNRAFEAHREGLRDIAELMDHEDRYGRTLWIRTCSPPAQQPILPVPPPLIVELSPPPTDMIKLAGGSRPRG